MSTKTFKTKKVYLKNFFFFTVYGAVVGENLTPIGEYSSTVKNRQKWTTVYGASSLKG